MATNAERNMAFAEAYYEAMNDRNAGGAARLLHDNVQFVGPMAHTFSFAIERKRLGVQRGIDPAV